MRTRKLTAGPATIRVGPVLAAATTLTVLAIIEVAVFRQTALTIGRTRATLLLIACSAAGLVQVWFEAVRGWRRLRTAAGSGEPVGADASTSMVGLFGAVLLALPGFFTAALGIVLLLPPSRRLIRRAVERSDDVGDLFGPRRVRVRTGDPRTAAPRTDTPRTATPRTDTPRTDSAAVEGEIRELTSRA